MCRVLLTHEIMCRWETGLPHGFFARFLCDFFDSCDNVLLDLGIFMPFCCFYLSCHFVAFFYLSFAFTLQCFIDCFFYAFVSHPTQNFLFHNFTSLFFPYYFLPLPPPPSPSSLGQGQRKTHWRESELPPGCYHLWSRWGIFLFPKLPPAQRCQMAAFGCIRPVTKLDCNNLRRGISCFRRLYSHRLELVLHLIFWQHCSRGVQGKEREGGREEEEEEFYGQQQPRYIVQ